MKKFVLFFALLFTIISHSTAQDGGRIYKKFKGELSLGYAGFPKNSDIKNGFIIALEPKFQVLDQLALGVRLETIILGKTESVNAAYSTEDDVKIKVYQSALATAEYYFTKEYKLRPFVGGGGGVHSVVIASSSYNDANSSSREVRFGGMIRGGVEIKHFRVGLEYNFVPNTENRYFDANGIQRYEVSKNSYFAIKLGVCFGGGPLNRG